MKIPRLPVRAGALLLVLAAPAAAVWPWSKPLTKEQVVTEGLKRYKDVRDDFAERYPDHPEWLTQLDTARKYFEEQSDSYLKQDLPYQQDELRRLKRVIDEQISGEQKTVEAYRRGEKKGLSRDEIDRQVADIRIATALRVQTAAMPELPKGTQTAADGNVGAKLGLGFTEGVADANLVHGAGSAGYVGGKLTGNGAGPNGGLWHDRVEAASLVVNLGVASVTCAQHPDKCAPPTPLPSIPNAPPPGQELPLPPGPVKPAPADPNGTPGNNAPVPAQPLPNDPNPSGEEPPTPIVLPPNWHQDAAQTATGPGATNGMITGGALAAERGDYSLALSLAKMALGRDPNNRNALALLHSVNGRAGAEAAGDVGRGAASAGAAALNRPGGDPGAPGGEAAGVFGRASAAPEIAALAAAGSTRAATQQAIGAARAAIGLGDPKGAVEVLSKALAEDPRNPALLNVRAALYGRLGQWEDSYKDAAAGLAMLPGDRNLLLAKAKAENRTRRYNDALATSSSLLRADPNNALGWAMKAHAEGALGDREAMKADLDKAVALDPRLAAQRDQAVQSPADADVLFLFPGEGAPLKGAPAAAPAVPSRGRSFSMIAAAGIAGGLLLALGLLSAVMGPIKEAATSAFTRRSSAGTPAGIPTTQPASVSGEVGGLIRGQYEVVRQIGAGGMGMVYEGRDRSLGRRVAIKKMREELRANPRERERFVIEAKTVAALRQPNIVDIYAIAEEGDDVYLVFEYVDGRTVHDLVQAAGRLQPGQAVAITNAIAGALAYAHSRGVIHRDMKPSNVMVTGSGEIKVMDFGIARMAKDAMTRYSMTNTVVGTPPYMAPEQEQGVVRKESDVYALAICSYEMLTGKLPFIGMGAGMLMNKINMSFIPPSRAIAGLPETFDPVFEKALQADPDKRYRTPQEFAAALSAAAGGSAVRA